MRALKHIELEISWQRKKPSQRPLEIETVDAARYGFFRLISHESQATQIRQADHSRPSSCVLFVTDGNHRLSVNKNTRAINTGDVIVWNNTETISLQCESNFQALLLLSSKDEFERKWRKLLPLGKLNKLDQHNALTSLGRSLLENLWHQHPSFSKDELEVGIDSVLSLLCRSQNTPKGEPTINKDQFPKMSEFIDHELHDVSLNAQKIADQFGCSLRTVHLIFSKHHKTIAAEIRNRRLERAKVMLIQKVNSLTISSIAFKFGFSDAGHFSRLFKERYGSTPREYRNLS